MKVFLKKISATVHLAQLAFFCTCLATLGTLSVASWLVLEKLFIEFSFLRYWGEPWEVFPLWFRWSSVGSGISAFVLNICFGTREFSMKYRIFYGSIGFILSITAVGAVFILPSLQLAFVYAALFLILPLFFFYKHWKWVIPCILCYAAALSGWYCYTAFLKIFFDYWNLDCSAVPSWSSWWCESANMFLFGGLLLQAKIYAIVSRKSSREIFTIPVWSLLLFAVFTWGASYILAQNADKGAKEAVAQWEKNSEISSRLEKIKLDYYDNGKIIPDGEYWNKFHSLEKKCYPDYKVSNLRFFHELPHGNLPEKEFEEWKKFFRSSPEIKELQKMFASAVPFPVYNFSGGPWRTADMPLGDLTVFFCNMQLWELNFALKEKNFIAAAEVLKRFDTYKRFLIANRFCVPAFLSLADIEFLKSFAWEKMLAAKAMDQQTICRQLQAIEADKKFFATAEKQIVENCGVLLLYCLNRNEHDFPRFIFPAFRHLFSNLRETVACAYRANTFVQALKRIEKLERRSVFKTLLPTEDWSAGFKREFTRLLVFETLLKLELEKRKKGFYPAEAPAWLPPDPFTGKKLHYCKGEISIIERVYNPGSDAYDRIARDVKAIAIWSEGENCQDDFGIGNHEKYGCDDIRAMILL